jgi:hypothetical protein
VLEYRVRQAAAVTATGGNSQSTAAGATFAAPLLSSSLEGRQRDSDKAESDQDGD